MSSAFQVSLPAVIDKSYSWVIQPSQLYSIDSISLFISFLKLLDGDCLYIYEGVSDAKSLIIQYCGTEIPYSNFNWIVANPGASLLLQVETDNTDVNISSALQFSYFSDGPNYHCGFPSNRVAILTASSMFFTDGSRSTENIPGDST